MAAVVLLMLSLAVPAGAYYDGYGNVGQYEAWEEDSCGILVPIPVACGISGIVCFGLLSLQKSVKKKSGASEYITERGVTITAASDHFTHTTQVRRKLHTEQHGGRNGPPGR